MNRVPFYELCQNAQVYLMKNYPLTFQNEKNREELPYYLQKFLEDGQYEVLGYTKTEVIEKLLEEFDGYSILTKYLKDRNVEEININSYEDISITYTSGCSYKCKESFFSLHHAKEVIRKLLRHSGQIIDGSRPIAQGHLEDNTRVTAILEPIVDKEIGISASIRLLHPNSVTKEKLISSGMLNEKMYLFLSSCLQYGISVMVAGRTSSGKTTLLNVLLSSIPKEKRIYTIESGARELYIPQKRINGVLQNNVVQTLSRPSERREDHITQEDLVVTALRFNPDLIVVGEIRDVEAHAAVEASLTGHTVLTSVHSGPGAMAHARIALLCQRRFQLGMEVSLREAQNAFPVVVFCHKLDNGERHVMDISYCEPNEEGCKYHTLFRYVEGTEKDSGTFECPNEIPMGLLKQMRMNGAEVALLDKFKESEGV